MSSSLPAAAEDFSPGRLKLKSASSPSALATSIKREQRRSALRQEKTTIPLYIAIVAVGLGRAEEGGGFKGSGVSHCKTFIVLLEDWGWFVWIIELVFR